MQEALVATPRAAVADERAGRLLARLALGLAAIGSVSILIQLAVVPGFWRTALATVPALLLLAGVYVLARSRHRQLATCVAVALPLIASLVVAAINPEDVIALAFPSLGIVLAGTLCSARAALVVGVTNAVAIVALAGLQPRLAAPALLAAALFEAVLATLVYIGLRHRARIEEERHDAQLALEARLRDQDRLVVLGTLSAAVAHELSSPLTAALLQMGMIGRRLREGRTDTLASDVQEAQDSLEQMQEILTGLRSMARDDRSGAASTDLGEALRTVLPLASAELRGRARIETELSSVPPVRAQRARLGQVVLNLVLNAGQAAPADRLATVRVTTRQRIDGLVELSVQDDGAGIPPTLHETIFEPFFTTKAPGRGTGLGLWISKRIVDELGGRIEVESRPGAGSTFRVLLPPAVEEATASAAR
jgi:C4-dicarboxylate-specific signal transduction histidine kinase